MGLTATLFPGICFAIAFALNFIALSYDSLNSIPITSMVISFTLSKNYPY